MSKPVVTKHQPSMSEWLEAIGEVTDSHAFRQEDNGKVKRLETLHQVINLPYERPEQFSARDLTDKTPAFAKVLQERGDELCAIRLVPRRKGLPKLRNRGLSIRECYETWYLKQDINPDDYLAYLCPHSETLLWSTIFVVNQEAIFGEVVRGLHAQLTHGDTDNKLYQFRYDYKQWQWSEKDQSAAKEVEKVVKLLRVPEKAKRDKLNQLLQAQFAHQYLTGYFETVVWPDGNHYFIDYNRMLPKYIKTPVPLQDRAAKIGKAVVSGVPVHPGEAEGRVVRVSPESINGTDFNEGDILVCVNTDVRFLPLMRKAGAIITDQGGLLSHAAIVARELKKPCLVGTQKATKDLRDGEIIKVDSKQGIVVKLNQG